MSGLKFIVCGAEKVREPRLALGRDLRSDIRYRAEVPDLPVE